ncbi:acyltransferase 3 [Rhizobium sp. CF080]|uniref:acyltransferase family protein n=1 Tax=Rhizobium sp. (strain CF080) TaxID=1144310 RepID=UPI000271B489|nr:acyltransferase [Rhizobium sp. CF080]EUB98709.1 acyltransferase 3 [Rhizobium sp. CF080]
MVNVVSSIATSPLVAFLIFCFFYACMMFASGLAVKSALISPVVTASSNRYGALDGLRGLLAYGVMFHHSMAAYSYFSSGVWYGLDNAVVFQLGKTTVALFFMITGFLFTEKCITGKVNWRSLYISRLFRLAPLYILVMLVMFTVIFALSGFQVLVPISKLGSQLGKWLLFGAVGRPNINGFEKSWTLIAGVNWSLRFEWQFYLFGLPVLFLMSRFMNRKALLTGVLTGLGTLALYGWIRGDLGLELLCTAHFLCGIAASLIYNNSVGKRLITSRAFHAAALFCLPVLATSPQGTVVPDLLATFAIFLSVLGGGSLWGLLKTRAAIWLGDISYGVYLIHGLALWLSYYNLSRAGLLDAIDGPIFLLLLPAIGLVVLAISSVSYIRVELPMIKLGRKLGSPKTSSRVELA